MEKSYSGKEVVRIIDDVFVEADKSIDDAYAEGYKAGLLETAGDVSFWQEASESSAAQNEGWFDLSSFSIGTAAGIFISFVVTSLINGAF